jgi:hypothetical protein
MQKIRSLILAAGLLASVGAGGATVLTLTQSAAPALAATPHCDPYCVGQPTAPALAVSLNFAKVEYKL